jgi:hypothetical protein
VEHEIASLLAGEWKLLEQICNLLEPFAEITSLSSGEKYDTLTYVIPCYYHLETHLNSIVTQQSSSPVRSVANVMLTELRRKFSFLVDSTQGQKNFFYACFIQCQRR